MVLALLPVQVVGHYDTNGEPQNVMPAWLCVLGFLVLHGIVFLYSLFFPVLFKYFYRLELFSTFAFLPRASQHEEKLQTFCEALRCMCYFMGIGFMLSVMGMLRTVAVKNGISALFSNDVMVKVDLCIAVIFIVFPGLMFVFPLWNFLKPDKKPDGDATEQKED